MNYYQIQLSSLFLMVIPYNLDVILRKQVIEIFKQSLKFTLPKLGLSLHDSSNPILNEMHDLVLKSIGTANQAATTI